MVWALAVTETVNYGVLLYAFAVFLTPMRRDLHASLGQLSGAFSLSVAVAGVLGPIAGAWLDRHGARALMTAGSLVAGFTVAGWSEVRSLPELYATFVGVGVASAAVLYDSAFALVNTWFRRDRNAALLTITMVAGLASTIFLPSTQALVSGLGWRHALWVLAMLCVLTALPHAILLRRHPSDVGHTPDGGALSRTDPTAPPPSTRPSPATPRPTPHEATAEFSPAATLTHPHGRPHFRDPDLLAALRQPPVRWLTVSTVTLSTAVTVVIVYLVSYLRATGYSPAAAATGAGAIGVLSVSGRLALTAFARRLRLARITAVMLGGQVAGIAALIWMPRPVGLVVFVLAFGAGFGVMTIARAALLGDYVAVGVFARVSGIQAMLSDAGRIAAPVVAGVVIGAAGYHAVLAGVAVMSAVAGAALLRADLQDRRRYPYQGPRVEPSDPVRDGS
jgi:MFS family permease